MRLFKPDTLFLIAIGSAGIALAKSAGNGPYAVTFSDGLGPFYARCVPAESEGDKGTTQILRVRKEGDEIINSFDWYNRSGLVLGWSPIAGKVAVMRLRQESGLDPARQIEFGFYLGNDLVHSWTTADLVKLGAQLETDLVARESGIRTANGTAQRAAYKVEGCVQVWNTNDYYFKVSLTPATNQAAGKAITLNFDIVTGKLCRVERAPDKNEERMILVD